MRIKLIRSPDAFSIMGGGAHPAFRVHIDSAIFCVRCVDVSPSVFTAHQKALNLGPAKYPVKHVVCKYFTIPQNNTSTNQENSFNAQMALNIIVGSVITMVALNNFGHNSA